MTQSELPVKEQELNQTQEKTLVESDSDSDMGLNHAI